MDTRRMKDEAAAHCLKGHFERAARAYQLVIGLEPQDARLRLRYAEVCRRAHAPLAAVAAYREAARLFESQGQWVCAHAALRLAAELAPGNALVGNELTQLEQRAASVPRG